MECKYSLLFTIPFRVLELIDTLWNVNARPLLVLLPGTDELIDTLWNVNVP